MSANATQYLFKFMSINATKLRRAFLASSTLLLSSAALPVLAAAPVHGPLPLPESDSQLAFYQQADGVKAYINGEQGQLLDSYPQGSEVVAVFYHDFDGDHHREVVVMLKTPSGQALRAYGDNSGFAWQPLTRAQTKLSALVPTLKSFTVAAVRQGVKPWPLQDFTTRYELPQQADDQVKAALSGKLAPQAQFSGYLDKDGKPTSKVDDAVAYRLQYPAQINANGQQYDLVAHYERDFYGQQDLAPFQLVSIGYERHGQLQGTQWQFMLALPSFSAVVVTANYNNGQLQGDYSEIDPRRGQTVVSGQYQAGVRVGAWQEIEDSESYWQGEYQQGHKVGKWRLYSPFADMELGEANYRNGKLNGHYEVWQVTDYEADASGKLPKLLLQRGEYVDDKKQGDWLMRVGRAQQTVRFDHGLRQGERLLTADNGTVLARENYVDDVLEGDASYYRDDGSLSAVKHFQHGQLSGSELSFNKHGKLYRERHYLAFKDGSGKWQSQQHGQALRYHGTRLTKVTEYQHGDQVGRQLIFDKQGHLKELHNYVLKDTRTDVELQGRQIWFKPRAPFGIATVANYQHGQKAGMEYHFADEKHLDEITQYCTAADGEQCRAGARYGWRYTYFTSGMSQCIEHYTAAGLVEYSCYRSDGKLNKSRQLLNGNQVIDREYGNGVVIRENVYQAQRTKTVNGKQVADLRRLKKEGISTQFYPDGQPHWQLLYRKGKQVCGKEFDKQGKQTAATSSCQFPLMLMR